MAIVRWTPAFNPARDLVSMQEDVNRFVDSFFSGRRGDGALFTPTVDVEETPEGFVIKADLPGVSQKDVKVSLMGDTLVIRGERSVLSLQRSAEILSGALANASLRTISEAGHFMTATHTAEVAELIGDHVSRVEALAWTSVCMDSPFEFRLRDDPPCSSQG